MLLLIIFFFLAPIPINETPNLPIGGKYWLVSSSFEGVDYWEAEVIERNGNNGVTRWFKYESRDGLLLFDNSPTPRNNVFRIKIAAQIWCAKKAQKEADDWQKRSDELWEQVKGK